MSHSALASLTATYTDSEDEDIVDADELDEKSQKGSVSIPNSVSNSRANSPIPATVNLVSNIQKLVSYHDDTIVSDDEEKINQTNNSGSSSEIEIEEIIDDGIQLPPEPLGKCSEELQEKIQRLYDKMENDGLDMNAVIQQRKDFRNPSIYEKLIQFCGINELGTNYPAEIYDPLRWGKESYYEELAKVQKHEMEKREKERRAKVEVVSGIRKTGQMSQIIDSDVRSQVLKSAAMIKSTLTSSATGTKGTVISAFGSLPRKPKI